MKQDSRVQESDHHGGVGTTDRGDQVVPEQSRHNRHAHQRLYRRSGVGGPHEDVAGVHAGSQHADVDKVLAGQAEGRGVEDAVQLTEGDGAARQRQGADPVAQHSGDLWAGDTV